MKITQDFIPKGNGNRPGSKNNRKWITVHETANTSKGANAKSHAKYVKNASTKTSWHFTVDSLEAYQHLPTNESGYHAGDGAGEGNRHSIGIEMSVNSDGNFTLTMMNTAKLIAKLMKEHNISLSNVVQHNKWSGKNCPTNLRSSNNKGWNELIELVKKELNPPKVQVKDNEVLTRLVKDKVITDKTYWSKKLQEVEYLDVLLDKIYNKYIKG